MAYRNIISSCQFSSLCLHQIPFFVLKSASDVEECPSFKTRFVQISTPGPLPLMSIHLSSMHHQSVQDGHHTLLTSEMLCYRSSNTLTPSSALRYQVKITPSINHSQCKTFLVLSVSPCQSLTS
ncbi:hypothetical protein P692DRAFT_2029381 [Suillus brevipes Sb2]|nr:hypothetical protein P692DRAFT_2029381 [Suillus brevipes Sb2]